MVSALFGVSIPRSKFREGANMLVEIDIALWDLKARKLGVPIHQLLGGKVRSKLMVYAWIGGDRPDDVEIQACACRESHLSANET